MASSHVEEIFNRVMDSPLADRERVLEDATREDVALRERVKALVNSIAEEDARAESVASPDRAALLPPEREEHPTSVGQFAIDSMLAEGGTSIVYRATQARPARPVALKLIRPWLASPGALARFAIEAELVGRLHHPGIAVVYDAGAADATYRSGRVESREYIAMELVEGLALTTHARERGLSLRERAMLIASVCDAVHAAHQRGVLHRDLKPANVLVTTDGRPKVLDFGAGSLRAEILAENWARSEPFADGSNRMGTGPYASPEHLDPKATIDTRSDVYSLGVMLYELLTESVPPRALGVGVGVGVGVPGVRVPSIRDAAAHVPTDLALITDRAMARSASERYGSAAELAADLRRFVRLEPVSVRKRSGWYEAGLFARRRRLLVAASAAGIGALAATAAVAAWQAVVATRAAHATRLALAEAEASTDFLERVLMAASPLEAGRDVRVREILELAESRVDAQFRDAPGAEARAREAIGRTLYGLGEYAPALAQLERAHELRTRVNGAADLATAKCGLGYAAALGSTGDKKRSAEMYGASLATLREVAGPSHPLTIQAMLGLASVEMDVQHFDAALALYREAIASVERRNTELGSGDYQAIACYAAALRWTGDLDGARAQFERAVPGLRSTAGEDHPWTLEAATGAARLAMYQGRTGDAESLLRWLAEARERVLGPGHAETLSSQNDLGLLMLSTGRATEARAVLEHLLVNAERTLGADHRNTLKTRFNLAQSYVLEGRTSEAIALLVPLLEQQRRTQGPASVDIVDSLHSIAAARVTLGELDASLAGFDESIAMGAGLLGDANPIVLRFKVERASVRVRLGAHEIGERELIEASDGLIASGDAYRADAIRALEQLAACQDQMGKADAAMKTRETLARLRSPAERGV
jgi:tetratricopeptide (TPR) repeat protein